MLKWVRTFYGYFAATETHLYHIKRYRAGKRLTEWRWVLRVDNSALQSPPVATTLREAKAAAEKHRKENATHG